jgi:chemotaxis regulatin CheY-phosphate phosphatase CheZ
LNDRLALLEAAANAERKLIEAERDAESALARAQVRLQKIESEYLKLEIEVKDRRRAVKEARAFLTAVQRQRANGPS